MRKDHTEEKEALAKAAANALLSDAAPETLTKQQLRARRKQLQVARGRILHAVETKLREDLKAYIADNEARIIFTVMNGGGFAISIEAFMPGQMTPTEAMGQANELVNDPTMELAQVRELKVVTKEEEEAIEAEAAKQAAAILSTPPIQIVDR